MTTIFQLYQIQSIDSKIDLMKKRIFNIDSLIENNIEIISSNKKLDQSRQIHKKIVAKFQEISDQVQARKIKIAQSESTLYSGSVKNPKELEDLQHEIASLKKAIDRFEEKQFEIMVVLEKSERDIHQKEEKLEDLTNNFHSQKSLFLGEKKELEEKIKSFDMQRNAITSKLSEVILKKYSLLRKTKKGLAVAKVEETSCSACGASLTASQRQITRSAETIFYCPSCGRMLYGS